MYKLIKIYTHGVAEVTGTPIFIYATFNTSKNDMALVAMYIYDARGVLEDTHVVANP